MAAKEFEVAGVSLRKMHEGASERARKHSCNAFQLGGGGNEGLIGEMVDIEGLG